MINFKEKKKVEINLIPMINIIFLLLIFFMLTGTIQKKLNPKIERPESNFSSESEKTRKKTINIALNKNGELFLNNKILSKDLFGIHIQKENIFSKILLDVDKNTNLTELNTVLKILKSRKFKKVFIRTSYIEENELSK